MVIAFSRRATPRSSRARPKPHLLWQRGLSWLRGGCVWKCAARFPGVRRASEESVAEHASQRVKSIDTTPTLHFALGVRPAPAAPRARPVRPAPAAPRARPVRPAPAASRAPAVRPAPSFKREMRAAARRPQKMAPPTHSAPRLIIEVEDLGGLWPRVHEVRRRGERGTRPPPAASLHCSTPSSTFAPPLPLTISRRALAPTTGHRLPNPVPRLCADEQVWQRARRGRPARSVSLL